MKIINKYTCDQKLKWWGYGEWVEEADECYFLHDGLDCKVLRICALKGNRANFPLFGGFLDGYVKIPSDHPFFCKCYSDIDVDIHGGLTYGQLENDGFWIGFDCAHSFDVVPSLIALRNLYKKDSIEEFKDSIEEFSVKQSSVIFPKSYRNMDYVIKECKSLADQVKQKKRDT